MEISLSQKAAEAMRTVNRRIERRRERRGSSGATSAALVAAHPPDAGWSVEDLVRAGRFGEAALHRKLAEEEEQEWAAGLRAARALGLAPPLASAAVPA